MSSRPDSSEPWTVARLLAWTKRRFEQQRVDSPRLCAEILLAHALKCPRLALFTQHEAVPAPAQLDCFRELVKQAGGGKPIAYLTGVKEFFSLRIEVTPDVLIPRPETEVLVERTIHLVRHAAADTPPPRILDVGAGSGCIAIALAKHLPQARLAASDSSEAALAVARRNAALLGVADRIEFRAGDLLTPWTGDDPFDIIVSNPPYVSTRDAAKVPVCVRDFEPHAALFAGEDGLDVVRRLVHEAPQRLVPGGHLLIEIAYDQCETVRRMLSGSAWRDFVAYRDSNQIERVVHARTDAVAAAQVA